MPAADSFYGPFGDPSEFTSTPTDPNAPTLLQASVSTSGVLLTLTFSKAVSGVQAPSYVLSGGHILSKVAGSSATRTMAIDPPVVQGETPLLSYSGSGTVSGAYPLLAFTNRTVVNASTVQSLGNPLYAGIHWWIRSRLQDSVDGISDSAFDPDIEIKLLELFGSYPGKSYAELEGDDKLFADKAVGLYVAISNNVPYQTGGLNAPLVLENVTGSDNSRTTRQTALISAGKNMDERVRWRDEADTAWRSVSFVSAIYGYYLV